MTNAKAREDLVDHGLDSLDPAVNSSRDATHFREILAAREAVDEAHRRLRAAVRDARAAGDSWAVIGAALDVSRQAAYDRFGRADEGKTD